MKRMLKLFFITSAMILFTGSVFVQNQQENISTKEETIAWLKEELPRYIFWNRKNNDILKITDKEFICEVWLEGKKSTSHVFPITAFVRYEHYEGEPMGGLLVFSEGKQIRHYDYDREKFVDIMVVHSTTPEIGKRIENAIKHLATFCSKKEAF